MQAAYAATSSHSANGACVQTAHVNSPTSYSCMLSGMKITDMTVMRGSLAVSLWLGLCATWFHYRFYQKM